MVSFKYCNLNPHKKISFFFHEVLLVNLLSYLNDLLDIERRTHDACWCPGDTLGGYIGGLGERHLVQYYALLFEREKLHKKGTSGRIQSIQNFAHLLFARLFGRGLFFW